MKITKGKILKTVGIISIVFLFIGFVKLFTSNTKIESNEIYVHIPTGSTFEDVEKIMTPYLKNKTNFEFMAQLRSYPKNVKSGRFLLTKGMSAFQQIASLRRNVPVNLAFNNQERLENLCERLSSQIEPDTTKLLEIFRDSVFLNKNGFNKENVLAMFLPNTYQVYWNTSAESFRDKMLEEFHKFWNKNRLAKSEVLGLTPMQVTTIASIVHKESVKKSERPIIAGVYLNRLNQGMPLQADPTVIYAVKLRDNNFDQVIKRVLYNDLSIVSPYNTYANVGLPPGPISMPDIDAIDAVLNAQKHNYLYFCASTEKFGYHVFSSSYTQHQVNARKYTAWLNTQGTVR